MAYYDLHSSFGVESDTSPTNSNSSEDSYDRYDGDISSFPTVRPFLFIRLISLLAHI